MDIPTKMLLTNSTILFIIMTFVIVHGMASKGTPKYRIAVATLCAGQSGLLFIWVVAQYIGAV